MTQINKVQKQQMNPAYFFGYGSLVNRDTHVFGGASAATLKGWRRVWRHTMLRPVAYLTVVPDPDSEIDGLIAQVPDQDWAALDERERAYDRVGAAHQIAHPLSFDPEIAVYTIPEGKHGHPTDVYPVLLSYVDVVVVGYLREYGEAGVARFFQTTDGWDAPIIDDRSAPIYPRHQNLSVDETIFVDETLKAYDIKIITRSASAAASALWPDA